MSMNLTKNSEKLICVMYKNYLDKRKAGISKDDAIDFGSSQDIHENLLPQWSFEDVNSACMELKDAELLCCTRADGIAYIVTLLDNGIIYMENRFKNNMAALIDIVSKLKP